jgi:acetyl esterase/lipase
LLIVALGTASEAAARENEPVSTTRTSARIAASWSNPPSISKIVHKWKQSNRFQRIYLRFVNTYLSLRSEDVIAMAITDLWTETWMDSDRFGPMRLRLHHAAGESRTTPFVLHLHGGAFVGGSAETGRTVAGLLAESGATVGSVDYPMAPGNPFPLALEGAYEALRWVFATCPNSKHCRMYVAGEEAGGNLAAGLALMARDQGGPPLAGQILLSPMLDPCLGTKSIRKAEAGVAGCKWAEGWHAYLGSADKASHPYAAPLGAIRLAGLPPALVVTAADDPMHDESLAYARRLSDCGVAAEAHVLAAPTGWPCALQLCPAELPHWGKTLRRLLTDFFAATASPHLARAPHGVRA